MVAPFPQGRAHGRNALAERKMQPVIDIVSAIRTIRSESRISPAVELAVTVKPGASEARRTSRRRPRSSGRSRARVIAVDPACRAAATIRACGGRRCRRVRAPRGRGRPRGRAGAPRQGDRAGAQGDRVPRGQARPAGLRRARSRRGRGARARAPDRAARDSRTSSLRAWPPSREPCSSTVAARSTTEYSRPHRPLALDPSGD